MTDLLAEALRDALASYPNACMPGTELDWCADHLRAALRERGVHLVTVESLARALDAVWPKHMEGTGSYPSSPTDRTYLVDDSCGAKPDATAILAALGDEA